jgi:EAL domain-containing protein (putative c-di-GMP-specific phosphodiesterase class I)
MAVKVSAHQLRAPGFLAMLKNILALAETAAQDICLEIPKSAFVQDRARALNVLLDLRCSGYSWLPMALAEGTGH